MSKQRNKKAGAIYRLGSLIASIALMVTVVNANTACVYIAHQSKLPDSAKKLRKF